MIYFKCFFSEIILFKILKLFIIIIIFKTKKMKISLLLLLLVSLFKINENELNSRKNEVKKKEAILYFIIVMVSCVVLL